MKEIRCHYCKKLIYKHTGNIEAEVICSGCRRINYAGRLDDTAGLRGKDFQAKALDHICSDCGRLLFRTIGDGEIETKCRYCKAMTKYDTIKMRSGKQTITPLQKGIIR